VRRDLGVASTGIAPAARLDCENTDRRGAPRARRALDERVVRFLCKLPRTKESKTEQGGLEKARLYTAQERGCRIRAAQSSWVGEPG
jgi:hypothetical protein